MHELSVVQSIVNTANDFCNENQIDNVKFMTLVVGKHTGVIPNYLQMYYNDVCADTKLEGSELRIEEVRTEYFCQDCGHVFTPINHGHTHFYHDHCPECNSEDLEVIAGDELMIKEIGYE